MSLESALGNIERYLKVWRELNRHIVLLTCYDFRTQQDSFSVSRQRLNAIIRKLRSEVPRNVVIHVADLRGFEIDAALVIMKDPELWRKIATLKSLKELSKLLPLGWLVSRVTLSMGSTIVITYLVPKPLKDVVLGALESYVRSKNAVISLGSLVPVRNCRGELGLKEDVVHELGEYGLKLASARPKPTVTSNPKLYFLGLILASMLDVDPLMGSKKLLDITTALLGRFEEYVDTDMKLKAKYVRAIYKDLSLAGVVGRVRVRPPSAGLPMLAIADPEHFGVMYGIAAAQLAGSRVFISDELSAIALYFPHEIAERKKLTALMMGVKADFYPVVATAAVPLPIEHYDPKQGSWTTESVDVMKALKRFGLLER